MTEDPKEQPESEEMKALRQELADIKKHLGLDKKKPTKDEILRSRKRSP